MPGTKQGEQNQVLYVTLQQLELKVGFSSAHSCWFSARLIPWLGSHRAGE